MVQTQPPEVNRINRHQSFLYENKTSRRTKIPWKRAMIYTGNYSDLYLFQCIITSIVSVLWFGSEINKWNKPGDIFSIASISCFYLYFMVLICASVGFLHTKCHCTYINNKDHLIIPIEPKPVLKVKSGYRRTSFKFVNDRTELWKNTK